MDEYVANKISKLIQLQCDINLLEFQLENPGSPHPTPYYEPVRIISEKIKRLQDRIEEFKEEVHNLQDRIEELKEEVHNMSNRG